MAWQGYPILLISVHFKYRTRTSKTRRNPRDQQLPLVRHTARLPRRMPRLRAHLRWRQPRFHSPGCPSQRRTQHQHQHRQQPQEMTKVAHGQQMSCQHGGVMSRAKKIRGSCSCSVQGISHVMEGPKRGTYSMFSHEYPAKWQAHASLQQMKHDVLMQGCASGRAVYSVS